MHSCRLASGFEEDFVSMPRAVGLLAEELKGRSGVVLWRAAQLRSQ